MDLAAGRLRVRDAKTDAGVPQVDLVSALREELTTHKARTKFAGGFDYVFPSGRGASQNPSNIRNRVLAKAIERADANLGECGATPLPQSLTPHSLRRTFISLLLALGEEVPYVMRQVGHSDPKVTLSIYAQVMFRGEGERERLRALVEGADLAPRPIQWSRGKVERHSSSAPSFSTMQGIQEMGAAGFEPATSRV